MLTLTWSRPISHKPPLHPLYGWELYHRQSDHCAPVSEALNICKLHIPYCPQSSGRLREQMNSSNSSSPSTLFSSVILALPPSKFPHLLPRHPGLFLKVLSNSYIGGHSSLANTSRCTLHWPSTYHTSPFYDSFSVHMLTTIADNCCPYTSRPNCSQACPTLPRGQNTPQIVTS